MDAIIRLGQGSQLQHGHENDRVYLMHVAPEDAELVQVEASRLAQDNGYSKIFGKLPESQAGRFVDAGYAVEATIPRDDAAGGPIAFVSHFLDAHRAVNRQEKETASCLRLAETLAHRPVGPLPDGLTLREATASDLPALAALYRTVFPSYPFPIHDPGYLAEILSSHVRFFLVLGDGQLLAASSAEQDETWKMVEMTDFATLPDARGRGLASHLLAAMERAMRAAGLPLAYTIARSLSPGMNITFAKAGYQLAGTLVNNTQISGSIQNMNVWYKSLSTNR
jgi:putative beta-lysine N-acetyltransferase